ncbi:unnamed protein product [Diamesa serratosioi]
MIKFLLLTLSLVTLCHSCRVIEESANGIQRNREDYPAHVLIESFTTYKQKYLCSGALISDQYVLTTAKCVLGSMFVNVHLYAHNLRDVYEASREIYRSTNFTMKPQYNGLDNINDVALIQLPKILNLATKPYKAVTLPTARDNLSDDIIGSTIGWGLLNFKDDKAAAFKKEQAMKKVSDVICRTAYPKWTSQAESVGRVCIQRTNMGKNCVSDEGSPFMIGSKIYGLQSFGQMEACETGKPNGLQEVKYHLDWIRTTAGLP